MPAISGRLPAAAMNLFTLAVRKEGSAPERSSRTKVTPPDVPTPGMDGGEKEKAMPSGMLLRAPATCRWMAAYCTSGPRAFFPRLQRDEEEGAVGVLHLAEETETDYGDDVVYAGSVQELLFDLFGGVTGAL